MSPSGDDSPGPQDNFYEDIREFMKFMHDELLEVKILVSNSSTSYSKRSSPEKSPNYERLLIRSLEDSIISLERQLAFKQNIIEKLLESPRPENRTLYFRSQLCPSRPLPNEEQQHSLESILASTMTNGEKNGLEITSMKNKKKKNLSPGVNKVGSDGISHNAP